MKTLVLYYSYGNNTRKIAEQFSEKLNALIYELEPLKPYTNNYQNLVDNEEAKMDQNEIIPIKNVKIDFNDYDRIILGTPVWWYAITPVMRSFLNKYHNELQNKEIYAFITNGGWLGHSPDDIKEYVDLKKYVNLEFDEDVIRKNSQENLDKFINDLMG